MSNIFNHLKKFIKSGNTKWAGKNLKFFVLRQQFELQIESNKTLLAVSLAVIGYNIFLLTGDVYHSKLMHIFSGAAILFLMLSCVLNFHNYKLWSSLLLENLDDKVINKERIASLKKPHIMIFGFMYRSFQLGLILTFISMSQIVIFTIPTNWY